MAFDDFLPEGGGQALNNVAHSAFLSLLASPGDAPFAAMPRILEGLRANEKVGESKAALKALLLQAGATPEQAEQFSASESVAKLALQNLENGKTDALIGGSFGGGGGTPVSNLGMGAPRMSPAAPGGPAAGASLNGGLSGEMGAFAGAIKAKESGGRYDIVGPTHPKMGRALGAYQVMEANLPQWSQEALGRTVTADEFLKSPEIQDAIFAKKFGQSVEKYGNPQDAASVWFTGRPAAQGATARDVLGTTGANYVASFNANLAKQRPTQVADASGAVPAAPAGLPVVDSRQPGFDPNSGVDPLAGFVSSTGQTNAIPTPARPVAVADNEQRAQALEAQMGMLPAGANRADLPAENAVPATTVKPVFDIPPGQTSDTATTRTQVAQRDYTRNKLQAEVQADLQKIAVLGTRGDRAKGAIEALKLKVQAAQKYLEPTDAQKILQAAGISTDDPQGQKMLLGAIPGNAPTGDIKEYEYGVADPAFAAKQLELAKARANSVTVNGGEKTYDAKQGESYSKVMDEVQAAGRKAPSAIATLYQAEKLLDTPGFVSGIGSTFALPAKQVLARLGGDPNAPAAMESFRSISTKMVLDSLGGSLGAGVSNSDVGVIKQQVASLDNSVEGNKRIIDTARRLEEHKQKIADFTSDYADRNGGRLDRNYDRELRAWAKQNPIFTPEERGEKPAAQGSTAPARRDSAPVREIPKVETTTDKANTIAQAKAYVAKYPEKRDALKKALEAQGIPTGAF